MFIDKLESGVDGLYELSGEDKKNSTRVKFSGKRIILALGAIATTRLVLDALKIYDQEIDLVTNPAAGFAFFMPERLGSKVENKVLSTGQISLVIANKKNPQNYALASLFPADAILSSEYIHHVPFSYPAARKIILALQPSMILGNCFLSGDYSASKIKINSAGKMQINGAYQDGILDVVKDIKKRLTKTMMFYGAFMLPGSFKLTKLGEDIHYAATLKMRENPTKKYELTKDGEVAAMLGIYVVDGAALTTLPAKPHSFTIMANADRIAKNLISAIKEKNL